VLAWATNITAFHIDAPADHCETAKGRADQFYRDAFPWLEVVGAAKGKPDAALHVLHPGKKYLASWGRCIPSGVPSCYVERTSEFKAALRELMGLQQEMGTTKAVKKSKAT
jgi:hypothetical protein